TCTGSQTARGPPDGSRSRRRRCGLPPRGTASAPRNSDFAAPWLACTCPCQRFATILADRRRMTWGHRGSLLLRCRAFSSLSSCRFIPALSPTFQALLVGFSPHPGARTITGMLQGAGLAGRRHHDLAYRFFATARWSVDEVGLVVAGLIVDLLLPVGAPVPGAGGR